MGTKQIKQSCKTGTEKGREYRSFKKMLHGTAHIRS